MTPYIKAVEENAIFQCNGLIHAPEWAYLRLRD